MKLSALLVLGALTLFAAGEHSNRRAPGFSLVDSKYRQHDLQDYRGKVVLIDFMKTDCAACNKLADSLVAMKAKYGDKLAILSIVTLPDTFNAADEFAARHKAAWPILFDSGQVMMSYLQLNPTGNMHAQFPHVFVIDGSGRIRNDFDGNAEVLLTVGGLSAEIERVLK